MNIQKINWKLAILNSKDVRPFDFFRVFNDWIPDSPEIFVDVADYQHVHNGPKVILVGHYVDYILEDDEGTLSFVFSQKRSKATSNAENLEQSLQAFKVACKRLQQDDVLKKLQFDTSSLTFLINDRALAQANESSYQDVKEDLSSFADKSFGAGKYQIKPIYAPKSRLTVQFKMADGVFKL